MRVRIPPGSLVNYKESMIKVNKNTAIIYGDLYTNMPFNTYLLSTHPESITIHVKGDVVFELKYKPSRMKKIDYWMDYADFIRKYPQGIKDIVAFSKIDI